jgi:hypothetical protein
LVITNSTGPQKSVRYNREGLCSQVIINLGLESEVITVIVITEFGCMSNFKDLIQENKKDFKRYKFPHGTFL